MISREESLRLDMLRFPLIVGVVFIHNFDVSVAFQSEQVGIASSSLVVDFIRNFLSQGVARIAVPLFFLMSGYLFFLKFDVSLAGYAQKLSSRLRTLFIPLVFWNLMMLALMAVAQSIPVTASFFSGRNSLISQLGILDIINAIFGIGRMPIAYQFWFVRDLIVLVLVSPLIYLVGRHLFWLVLALLLPLWVADIWPLPLPSIEALLFFFLGARLGICKKSLFALDAQGLKIACVYVILAVLDAVASGTTSGEGVHKLAILFGVITALWVTGLVIRSEVFTDRLVRLGATSFFVYAAHEPLLTVCKKLIYRLLHPESPILILTIYLALPIFIISVIVWLYPRLQRCLPGFVAVVSGGR